MDGAKQKIIFGTVMREVIDTHQQPSTMENIE
jgi:hypothetical protein